MNDPAVMCHGKCAFDTKQLADAVAEKMNRRHTSSTNSSYRCPICHKYHVGNSKITTAKQRQQKRRRKLNLQGILG